MRIVLQNDLLGLATNAMRIPAILVIAHLLVGTPRTIDPRSPRIGIASCPLLEQVSSMSQPESVRHSNLSKMQGLMDLRQLKRMILFVLAHVPFA